MRVPVPPLVDVVIAGAFVLLVAAEALFSPAVQSPAMHLAVAGLAMAALAWRRTHPVLVAALVMTSNLLVNPDEQLSTLLALVLVSYTNGAENDPPRSYLGLAVVAVPFLGMLSLEGLEPSDLAAALVFLVGPWTVGVAMRQRALRASHAEAQVRRLEQQREEHVAAAAAAERTQMRRLFGVLRSDGEAASLSPQPGLHELERLCEQVRASGLDVEVVVEGSPHALPAGLDLTAYRIVQEGLTNALRHSGARRATVLLRYGAARLDIAVDDDGHGFDPATAASDGHGLVGVRERVALYEGTVQVLPSTTRGTRLVASLPLEAGR